MNHEYKILLFLFLALTMHIGFADCKDEFAINQPTYHVSKELYHNVTTLIQMMETDKFLTIQSVRYDLLMRHNYERILKEPWVHDKIKEMISEMLKMAGDFDGTSN